MEIVEAVFVAIFKAIVFSYSRQALKAEPVRLGHRGKRGVQAVGMETTVAAITQEQAIFIFILVTNLAIVVFIRVSGGGGSAFV